MEFEKKGDGEDDARVKEAEEVKYKGETKVCCFQEASDDKRDGWFCLPLYSGCTSSTTSSSLRGTYSVPVEAPNRTASK